MVAGSSVDDAVKFVANIRFERQRFFFLKNDFPADCSSQNAGETPFLSLSNPPTPLLPRGGLSSTTFLGEEMKNEKKEEGGEAAAAWGSCYTVRGGARG